MNETERQLRATIALLRSALEHYADRETWVFSDPGEGWMYAKEFVDPTEVASKALTTIDQQPTRGTDNDTH